MEYEGIYFFGGRDEKGPKNKLSILKIGQKQCEWISPSIDGPSPIARYGHSFSYVPAKNIAVLFGGRNDENFASTGQSSLNDVWILALEKLTWQEWIIEEKCPAPIPRYSHCAVVMGTSIAIFGGLGEENYCPSDVFCLDFVDLTGQYRFQRMQSKQSVGEYATQKKNTEKDVTRLPNIETVNNCE